MYPLSKKIFDRSVAAVLLMIVVIPGVTLGLINALVDQESALFRQARVGKDGKIFDLYKIRTMKAGRITPFGSFLRRWSVDEIPQLWNVIRGDMSMVGPRPLLLEYRKYYSARQNKRHEVMPGITGLAQVNGRNSLEWEKRFELDVYYVKNQSFLLDLKILAKTIIQLFDHKSADHHHSTLPKFFEQGP